jgi:hypothetical protein
MPTTMAPLPWRKCRLSCAGTSRSASPNGGGLDDPKFASTAEARLNLAVMSGGVTLTAVQGWDYWRVKMAWPDSTPRYFGKFASNAEAEKWIAEHHWMTEQSKVAE